MKRTPKFRFREIVRKVIHNLSWLSEGTDEYPDIKEFLPSQRKEGQVLSLDHKIALVKPKDERDSRDIELISQNLGYFKAFRTYPAAVRTQLVWKAMFVYYKGGQVVVRQGQHANFMYFIITGVVAAVSLEKDPIVPDENKTVEDQLTTGDCFGDIALMYNEPHTSTVTVLRKLLCLIYSAQKGESHLNINPAPGVELLVLPRRDFKSILEKTVKEQWETVRWALSKFPYYFDSFPESAVRYICTQASVCTRASNELLPTVDSNGIEITTFVLDGALRVIQRLLFVDNERATKIWKRFKLYHDQSVSPAPKHVAQAFLQTCRMSRTSVFGLGEIMSNHSIMSDTDLLVLVIPRYILFRYNVANIWDRIVAMLDMVYPTNEQLLKALLENRMFASHKKKLIKNMYKHLTGLDNTIHDTSVSDRAEKMTLSKKMMNNLLEKSVKYTAFNYEDKRESQFTNQFLKHQQISRIISRGQSLSDRMIR